MAALKLAAWMRRELARTYLSIQLVGHSHGGNIAIRAAALQPRRVCSVVTLATPFLHGASLLEDALPRVPMPDRSRFGASIALMLGIIIMIGTTPADELNYVGSIIVILVLSLAAIAFLNLRWDPYTAMQRAGRRYTGFGHTTVPTLVITYFVDEALSAIWMGLALPERLLAGATKLASDDTRLKLGISAVPVMILVALGFGLSGSNVALAGGKAVAGISMLLLICAVLMFVANRITGPVLAAMALGPRSAADFFHMKLRVTALPSSSDPELIQHVELAPPEGWRPRFSFKLRHCYIYSDPQTVDLVIDWLTGNMPVTDRSR